MFNKKVEIAFDASSTGKRRGKFVTCKFYKYDRPTINRHNIDHDGLGMK